MQKYTAQISEQQFSNLTCSQTGILQTPMLYAGDGKQQLEALHWALSQPGGRQDASSTFLSHLEATQSRCWL